MRRSSESTHARVASDLEKMAMWQMLGAELVFMLFQASVN
jgi:hypothetical protein